MRLLIASSSFPELDSRHAGCGYRVVDDANAMRKRHSDTHSDIGEGAIVNDAIVGVIEVDANPIAIVELQAAKGRSRGIGARIDQTVADPARLAVRSVDRQVIQLVALLEIEQDFGRWREFQDRRNALTMQPYASGTCRGVGPIR